MILRGTALLAIETVGVEGRVLVVAGGEAAAWNYELFTNFNVHLFAIL